MLLLLQVYGVAGPAPPIVTSPVGSPMGLIEPPEVDWEDEEFLLLVFSATV